MTDFPEMHFERDGTRKGPFIADFLHVLDDRAVSRQILVRHRELLGMGLSPVLICATRNRDADAWIPDGARILNLDIGKASTAWSTRRLVRVLRGLRPDVLFSHHSGPNRAAVIARAVSRVDARLVVMERTHYSTFGWSHRGIRDRMTAMLYPRADRVAGVSESVVADLTSLFPAITGKTVVLNPAGPDPEKLRLQWPDVPDHPWYRATDRPGIICSIGNVVPRKGQDTLIDALPLLRRLAGNVKLVLIGRPDDTAFVEWLKKRAAALGVAEHVWLGGYHANPIPYLANADAFAFGSLTEGCPTVITEAQACGIPVVACDSPGGIAEAVEHGRSGLLVPPRRPDLMAQSIARVLLDGDARDRLVKCGTLRARSLTPQRVTDAHLSVAEECIREHRTRAVPGVKLAQSAGRAVAVREPQQRVDTLTFPIPLRVGIVLRSQVVPRWIQQFVTEVGRAAFASLALVVVLSARPSREAGRRHSWLYGMYSVLDEKLFPLYPDPLERSPLRIDPASTPLLEVSSAPGATSTVDAIGEHDLDVLICLDSQPPGSNWNSLARHGIWSIRLGTTGNPSGAREVLEGAPAIRSAVHALRQDGEVSHLISEAYRKIHKRSVHRTVAETHRRSPGVLLGALRDLHDSGPALHEAARPEASLEGFAATRTPTNYETARGLLRMGKTLLGQSLQNAGSFNQWILGMHLDRTPSHAVPAWQLGAVPWTPLVPPRDRFWADPFPIRKFGRYYVFVEEYLYGRGRAHIAVMEVAGDGSVQAPVPVLERECHLSYPFLLEWKGETFMIPESGSDHCVDIYRAASFPDAWVQEGRLFDGLRAVDSTLIEMDGLWWLFAGVAQEQYSRPTDWHEELHLFHAPSPMGPWVPHRHNPVKLDVRASRPAGALFWWNGELYRPAQDCSVRYGYAVSINRVLQLDTNGFREELAFRLTPDWFKGLLGTHTFNCASGLITIDGRLQRRKWRDRLDTIATTRRTPVKSGVHDGYST